MEMLVLPIGAMLLSAKLMIVWFILELIEFNAVQLTSENVNHFTDPHN